MDTFVTVSMHNISARDQTILLLLGDLCNHSWGCLQNLLKWFVLVIPHLAVTFRAYHAVPARYVALGCPRLNAEEFNQRLQHFRDIYKVPEGNPRPPNLPYHHMMSPNSIIHAMIPEFNRLGCRAYLLVNMHGASP